MVCSCFSSEFTHFSSDGSSVLCIFPLFIDGVYDAEGAVTTLAGSGHFFFRFLIRIVSSTDEGVIIQVSDYVTTAQRAEFDESCFVVFPHSLVFTNIAGASERR